MRSTDPAEISTNDVKSNDFSLFCCCSSTFPTGVRVTSIRNIKESEATISFKFLIYSNRVVKVKPEEEDYDKAAYIHYQCTKKNL